MKCKALLVALALAAFCAADLHAQAPEDGSAPAASEETKARKRTGRVRPLPAQTAPATAAAPEPAPAQPAPDQEAAAPAPADSAPRSAPQRAANAAVGEVELYGTNPRDAAVVMAIVADRLGKPLQELRFKSIKEVDRR